MEREYAERYERLYHHHWWWRARTRLIERRLADLPLPENAQILDVGCGNGLLFPVLERFGSPTGIETDTEIIDFSVDRAHRIRTDPLGSPRYAGEQYDLITALDVIEHIEDDRAAVDSLCGLLANGGYLLLTVPAMPTLWTRHDEINQHYRRYTRTRLETLLASSLQLLDVRYLFHSLWVPKWLLARLETFSRAANSDTVIAPDQTRIPPRLVNGLLHAMLVAEARVLGPLRLPFGTSLIAIGCKTAA